MKYYCNPLNLEYHYQYSKRDRTKKEDDLFHLYREAADPSLILFKGKYLMFTSMTSGFYESDDLVHWEFYRFCSDLPIYDYAPDVCVIGDYLYFSASKRDENCPFYRTKDPHSNEFEKVDGFFPFWDPNLFKDDDGTLYLYWGCSNITPVYGVALDPTTLAPLSDPHVLIDSDETTYGFERNGEDYQPPKSKEQIEAIVQMMMKQYDTFSEEQLKQRGATSKEEVEEKIRRFAGNRPCVEGAWMTKYQGKYYLQYATPGTQYNVYCDAVYIGDSPLGPFHIADNNPYSYKPGGFITGAGHGSTLKDLNGNYWHTSTMRISQNDRFERRIGLWKAGFDEDGELYCDQRYGDWPISMESKPFDDPTWMLLSYKKAVKASSGSDVASVVDEDIRTWWKADTNQPNEWIEVDLGKQVTAHAIQINFADDSSRKVELPKHVETFYGQEFTRYLDQVVQPTTWYLEGSLDGISYFMIEDKSEVTTDLAHDWILSEEGIPVRFLRLTILQLPYQAIPCISGIRVFGESEGVKPPVAKQVLVKRLSDIDVHVQWIAEEPVVGYNILWGHAPEKLYHSYMVFGKSEQIIGALTKGQPLFLRVDTFHESGIQKGEVQEVR